MKVIVTGSNGLIGKSICNSLQQDGYEVIKVDLALGHDLTDEEFVKEFFMSNKANALINLFALNHHIEEGNSNSDLFNISLNSFKHYLNTNITALFSVCREFAKHNKGSIVNFSSTYGVVSPRLDLYNNEQKHIGYSVSKSAVLMLTKHLATHLAPHIRVNTVIPGGVEHTQDNEFKNKYSIHTPLGRMMKINELYGTIEYLISNKSSYVTGTEIKIDGGWTAL